jgi:hypothetical protein
MILSGNKKGFNRGLGVASSCLVDAIRRGQELAEDGDLALVGQHKREHQGVHEGSHDGGLAGHEDAAAGGGQGQQHTRGQDEKEQNDSEHLVST